MNDRHNQGAQIFALLKGNANTWVPLPSILALGIAQYNARIFELRSLGHKIENKTSKVNGKTHSWFKLVIQPTTGNLFDGL